MAIWYGLRNEPSIFRQERRTYLQAELLLASNMTVLRGVCVRRQSSPLTHCYVRRRSLRTERNTISGGQPREFGTKIRRLEAHVLVSGDRAVFRNVLILFRGDTAVRLRDVISIAFV